jgi:glycosyltransferase involved in cell wall biosynthesis
MNKLYKVLILEENSYVPIDARVWAEATTLCNNGFQVSIICPKGPIQHRESYVCLDDIHIYRYELPRHSGKHIDYLKEYVIALGMTFLLSFKVLFRHGFDAIHAANPRDLFFVIGLFYRLFGKKFIFDQHVLAPEMFEVKFQKHKKLYYKLLIFFEWCSYKTANLVITIKISQKSIALQRGHCRTDRVIVVRNGPDLKRLQLVQPESALKRGKRYLLAYLGLIGSQDGVQYSLHAPHELIHKRGRKDISLVVMGDGDYASVIHRLAHELELDEYVYFTGWIERKDIQRYLTIADVGICPEPKNSMNEYSTMVKTMEYMTMGKPIVAFDLAETRFSAQDAGLYATPNSVEDLADKIETLLGDEKRCQMMGTFGRKRIEEELSWDHSKAHLLQAYRTLLSTTKEIVSWSKGIHSNRS